MEADQPLRLSLDGVLEEEDCISLLSALHTYLGPGVGSRQRTSQLRGWYP